MALIQGGTDENHSWVASEIPPEPLHQFTQLSLHSPHDFEHEDLVEQEDPPDETHWEDSHAYTTEDYGKHYQDEEAYYINHDPYQEQTQDEDLDELIRQTQHGTNSSLEGNGFDMNDLIACGLVDESGVFSFQHDALMSLVQPIEEAEEEEEYQEQELTIDLDAPPHVNSVQKMPSIPSLPSLPGVPCPALPGVPVSGGISRLPPSTSTEYFRTLPSISLESEDIQFSANPLYTDKA